MHVSSSLRIAIEAHVAETLREAGRPLNAVEIAESSSIDPDQLSTLVPALSHTSVDDLITS